MLTTWNLSDRNGFGTVQSRKLVLQTLPVAALQAALSHKVLELYRRLAYPCYIRGDKHPYLRGFCCVRGD